MSGADEPAEPGALEVTASVTVKAPARTVFNGLSDWERQGEWIPFTTVRVVDGDGGEGSTIEAVTSIGPAALRDEMQVTRLDPPYEIRVVHTGRVLRGPGVLRCTPLRDERTQVVWHEWFYLPGGWPGRLAGPAGRAGAVARLEGRPDPGAAPVRQARRGGSVAMSGLLPGSDGRARCPWAVSAADYQLYHDREWGKPVHGDDALYERLTLEAFQSGLSWLTILRKRPAFRAGFDRFQLDKVARYGEAEVARLLADRGIVRNRAKIEAAIHNARAALDLPGGLHDLLWSFAPPPRPRPATLADVPPATPESTAMAKELKRRGFRFVGPTTAYALMQACGMVDDHLAGCHVLAAGGLPGAPLGGWPEPPAGTGHGGIAG